MTETLAVQQKIDIEDIQEGVVILRGGELRAVLMTSSINFALKSEEEQDALIFKYQQFLNSLDFPVQILTVSRKLDISGYLAMLEQKKKEQPNELLQIQISEYVDFVHNLVEVSNIMSQSFFVVVPLTPMEKKEAGLVEKLGLSFKKEVAVQQEKNLEEMKNQLWQRVEYVVSGLSGLGLNAVPLNNDELTELFYHLYNMGLKEKPTLKLGKES
ncbi:MAG: hypothetical protein PHW33_01910 [Candidatus Portnoybacteria bacterium]|jgi:hypothetical protein|nr:hypothetical protein [Candidatus Portnoybacteria bacterium]